MMYFWFIPLAIAVGLLVWGLYLRFRRRARRMVDTEEASPLEQAKELDRRATSAPRRHRPPPH